MIADTNISLADLRSDHATAEAEAEKYEEQARLARERSARLASMIQNLEEWAEERQKRATPPNPQGVDERSESSAKVEHRAPTAGELAVRILERVGHPLPTRELAELMAEAGYRSGSKKPLWDAVYGVLTGALKVKGARLVKIGTNWGLREWKR